MTSPLISVQGIRVSFGDVEALTDLTLDIPAGGMLALVGPSGCGKTTALRVIAGFQDVDAGSVAIGEREVLGPSVNVAPEKRNVGMVFQDYALFPHISVGENVGYGVSGSDRVARVTELLDLVGLSGYESRFPHELSGGEQQRVALARALAPSPDVVLLDEPFSNLDAPQRERMRRELKRIIRSAGVTAVLVTHDQAEALAIADVIAVMRDGAIRQVGTPYEVYRSPSDPWVADFLGDAIVLSGVVRGGAIATSVGSVETDVADGTTAKVMIRPEWLKPSVVDGGQGEVIDTEFYGHDQRIEIALINGDQVEALVPSLTSISIGDSVDLEILDAVVFPS